MPYIPRYIYICITKRNLHVWGGWIEWASLYVRSLIREIACRVRRWSFRALSHSNSGQTAARQLSSTGLTTPLVQIDAPRVNMLEVIFTRAWRAGPSVLTVTSFLHYLVPCEAFILDQWPSFASFTLLLNQISRQGGHMVPCS